MRIQLYRIDAAGLAAAIRRGRSFAGSATCCLCEIPLDDRATGLCPRCWPAVEAELEEPPA